MSEKENILIHTYEFVKMLIPVINKLPRDHKFVLGDRVINRSVDVLELFLEAYYTARPQKAPLLARANISVEILRYHIRLLFELRLISTSQYERLTGVLADIGRQCGGWLKALA